MNYYYEQYCQIAKDFGLYRYSSYICTLPGIHPSDFIMKYDGQKHRIYCADHLGFGCAHHLGFGCGYIYCFGFEELRPKLARERIAKLVEQYKQLNIQKKLNKIREDF